MSFLDAPSNNAPRETLAEGKYTGVLYMVVDCGSRVDTFQGVDKIKREVYVCWELVDTEMADGRPFVIGNFYTLTNGQWGPYFAKTSNACKMLKSWTGLDEQSCTKANLLGKLIRDRVPCTITVGEQAGRKDPTRTYNIIESVKPYKGSGTPVRINNAVVYALSDGAPGAEVPEWLRNRIADCLENTNPGALVRKEADVAPPAAPVHDEDVPF